MRNRVSLVLVFLFLTFPAFTQINIYFFYEELCGNCHDDEARFMSILLEKLPVSERSRYPNFFHTINVYEISGRSEYLRLTNEYGLDRGQLELPFMLLGGRVFQGYDSIGANLREAFFASAEALREEHPDTESSL